MIINDIKFEAQNILKNNNVFLCYEGNFVYSRYKNKFFPTHRIYNKRLHFFIDVAYYSTKILKMEINCAP